MHVGACSKPKWGPRLQQFRLSSKQYWVHLRGLFSIFLKKWNYSTTSKENRQLGRNAKGRMQVQTRSKPAVLAHTAQAVVRISNNKHLGLTARK